MIGQETLRDGLKTQLENGKLPQFIILVGRRGSGRKTLIRDVFGNDGYWLHNVTVNSVREMIEGSYHYHDTLFVLPDADNMSMQAKHALLKVVEECPNNNRYIITLENLSATLAPIRSRAAVWYMQNYTSEQIEEYARNYFESYNEDYNGQIMRVYKEVCSTPWDVMALTEFGGLEFYNYVEKVVDNIAAVSGANAFKIADKLSMKDGDGKYDLWLFFKTFIVICADRFKSAPVGETMRYVYWSRITNSVMNDLLTITGINKQGLVDEWILRIREAVEWN